MYRTLEKGEIIQAGDEVDGAIGWNDEPRWRPVVFFGAPAPDPQYLAHRIYRRRLTPLSPDGPAGQIVDNESIAGGAAGEANR